MPHRLSAEAGKHVQQPHADAAFLAPCGGGDVQPASAAQADRRARADQLCLLLGQAIRSHRPFDVARLGLTLLLRRPDLAAERLFIQPSRWLLQKVWRTLRQKWAGVADSAPEPSRFEIGNP